MCSRTRADSHHGCPGDLVRSTHWLTNLLYDCLIWRKSDGSGYVGQAAEKWENVDATTWRFYLRTGLTFHNGEPLDAEAVKWNIDRVRTRRNSWFSRSGSSSKKSRLLTLTTVEILTNEPRAYFEYDVSYNGCELLPPKYMEQVGEEEFAKKPVGSGPYKLAEFTANEKYVFEAWDEYWGGRPEVDRVIYQVIPEKASQIAALLAGQIDLVSGIPPPDLAKVKAAKGIETMNMTSNRLHMLYLRSETGPGNMAKKYPDYQPLTLDKKSGRPSAMRSTATCWPRSMATASPPSSASAASTPRASPRSMPALMSPRSGTTRNWPRS